MKLTQLFQKAAELENKTVAVAHAEDDEVLQAVKLAVDKEFARFLLIGHREKIRHMMEELDMSKRHVDIIHSETPESSARIAVQSVKSGNADVLMKGHLPTAVLLKAVLNKEYGLRSSRVLSHVAAFEVNGFDRLIYVTDAAMNIKPGLEELKQILENAVRVARAVGVNMPKAACLAAVETVNPAMEATLHAASLTQMNHRGKSGTVSSTGLLLWTTRSRSLPPGIRTFPESWPVRPTFCLFRRSKPAMSSTNH